MKAAGPYVEGKDRDMIVFGSGSIVSQLTEHGLIDGYRFIEP